MWCCWLCYGWLVIWVFVNRFFGLDMLVRWFLSLVMKVCVYLDLRMVLVCVGLVWVLWM